MWPKAIKLEATTSIELYVINIYYMKYTNIYQKEVEVAKPEDDDMRAIEAEANKHWNILNTRPLVIPGVPNLCFILNTPCVFSVCVWNRKYYSILYYFSNVEIFPNLTLISDNKFVAFFQVTVKVSKVRDVWELIKCFQLLFKDFVGCLDLWNLDNCKVQIATSWWIWYPTWQVLCQTLSSF